MRILLALLVVPLLLAPVRLKDATPGFFMPPAQSPAPESYSLPSAEPLITPTVILVSPTLLSVTSTEVVSPTSLNLPLPPSPTAPAPQPVPQRVDTSNLMSPTSAALCEQGMILVRELALVSYREERKPKVLKLSLAAAMSLNEVSARQWPNLTAFNNAVDDMPWFYPEKAEIQDGIAAATALCTRPY